MNHLSLKKMTKHSEFYVFLIVAALMAVIQAMSGQFFTSNNICDLMRSLIVPGMYALCAYITFLSTGPDVSFPLMAALSSYLATMISIKTGYTGPVVLVYLIAVFFGTLMGALNGFIITKYKFNSLIVTLGTSSIFSGILLGAFSAERTALPANMAAFGKAAVITVKNPTTGVNSYIPMAFLILIALYAVAYFVLNYTMFGRGFYAVGGDEVAAERAGFHVNRTRFSAFCISGAIAGIAGVTYTVLAQMYLPTEFSGREMIVIAAIVLGGTRLSGGVGTLTGCVLGTLLLTMVQNSLILVGVSVYWQNVIIGIVIIFGTVLPVIQNLFGKRKVWHKKEAQS